MKGIKKENWISWGFIAPVHVLCVCDIRWMSDPCLTSGPPLVSLLVPLDAGSSKQESLPLQSVYLHWRREVLESPSNNDNIVRSHLLVHIATFHPSTQELCRYYQRCSVQHFQIKRQNSGWFCFQPTTRHLTSRVHFISVFVDALSVLYIFVLFLNCQHSIKYFLMFYELFWLIWYQNSGGKCFCSFSKRVITSGKMAAWWLQEVLSDGERDTSNILRSVVVDHLSSHPATHISTLWNLKIRLVHHHRAWCRSHGAGGER